MNGQFLPTPAAGGDRRQAQSWGDADTALLRLLAALVLSCLLHAALVLLPYLGQSSKESRLTLAGRQTPPPLINATLMDAGEHVYSAASIAAKPLALPEKSAADRLADLDQPAVRHRAEGVDLLPLQAPVYYTTDQLTKRPQPVASAELDAPEIRPIVASGTLVLTLWINEFGVVADVAVEKTDLPEVFSRTAVAAFKHLRFQPGERSGQPVGTVMRIEVTYADGRARTF